MDMDPAMLSAYVTQAFEEMEAVLDRLGGADLNVRPFGDETNSISALVTHATAVSEFWLGHVGLGHPTNRDRDSEFRAESDDAGLRTRIATAHENALTYIGRLDAGEGQPSAVRETLVGDQTDGSIVVHVIEELYQHVGHMDITADALLARPA